MLTGPRGRDHMKATEFRTACEAYDRIAGPDDWASFAGAFDRVLEGLTVDDMDVVGRVIQALKQWRLGEPTSPRGSGNREDILQTLARHLSEPGTPPASRKRRTLSRAAGR